MPELGPGVIGNGLLEPAFIPKREAARAGSSGPFGPSPFGQALPPCAGGGGFEPVPELLGVIAGKEPAGGQVGMASNGEPSPVGGTDPRCVFGIALAFSFGSAPAGPGADLCPSGVACHGVVFDVFGDGGGPMTIGALGFRTAAAFDPLSKFDLACCV